MRQHPPFSVFHRLLLAAVLALPAAQGADTPPAGPVAPVTGPGVAVTLTAPKPDEVVNPLDCERLLAAAGHDLNRADPAFAANFTTADNPFFAKEAPPPDTAPASNTTAPAPPPVPSRLSDAEKLAQLADVLRPSGTMGSNGVLLLIFENRPPLRVGQVLKVTFPNEDQPTQVLLLSVTPKAYMLKLNGTVLPVPLNRPVTAPAPAKP